MAMLPFKIRKPSEWRTVKTQEVKKAVEAAKPTEASVWSDVAGWSFSPKEIGNYGPQAKRRRMFTGTIYPSEFLDNVALTKKHKLIMFGIGMFVLFDLVMFLLLIDYLL